QHLLELGHEKIGMLNWHPGLPVGDAREAGYREAMQQVGIKIQPDWVVYTPNILQSAAAAAHQLMTAKHTPTAIICANDVMAFGAKTYFDQVDLQIGDDIALTGYDNDPTSEFLGITSVHQPVDQVAATIFDLLLGELNGESRSERQIIFDPVLVARHSTRK
ncbi:MAG TPA: substrate-binding domain-containing protein, partial [Phototrophicaceae bacterium]|nr:substrate-binding domain-containing protein [Phototrophicaceae bacterium]